LEGTFPLLYKIAKNNSSHVEKHPGTGNPDFESGKLDFGFWKPVPGYINFLLCRQIWIKDNILKKLSNNSKNNAVYESSEKPEVSVFYEIGYMHTNRLMNDWERNE